MAVIAKPLIPTKDAEAVQTTQYIADGARAIIDKLTAHNHSESNATITVHLVNAAAPAANSNIVVKKMLAASETYTFPEVVGHVLGAADFISTIASAGSAISIRASGREIT